MQLPEQDAALLGSMGIDKPVLRNYPDGRRSPLRLFSAMTLVYVTFVLGPAIGGLAACYNSLCLRRGGAAARALLYGLFGWGAFVLLALLAASMRIENIPAIFLTTRIAHFGIGGLLAWSQVRYLRGHAMLQGGYLPLLPTYLVAFGLTLLAPWRMMLVLWGIPGGT